MDGKIPDFVADDWRMTDRLHAEHGKGDPFAAAIRATRMSMIITDPRQDDNPIVFANNAFLRLTGYDRDEVVGRNCRFLQGPGTDAEAVERVRQAISEMHDVNVDILNYRKDGEPFWNALYISPVINEAGELLFYFASQLDVTDRKQSEHQVRAEKERFEQAVKERTRELEAALEARTMLLHEVDHRVKNNLQMVSSLIVMQSRTIEDERVRASMRSMLERVEALGTVHRRLYQARDVTRFDVAEFVRDLVGDLVGANGRADILPRLELEPVEVAAERAAPLALMINELVTNAIKHAFKGDDGGEIFVRVGRVDGHFQVEVSDDGAGIEGLDPAGPRLNGSFGLNLIRSLGRQLQADITWLDGAPGTRVVIAIPIEPVGRRNDHERTAEDTDRRGRGAAGDGTRGPD